MKGDIQKKDQKEGNGKFDTGFCASGKSNGLHPEYVITWKGDVWGLGRLTPSIAGS